MEQISHHVVLQKLRVFNENINVDTIYPNGLILYKGIDFKDSDAQCCPSKEWEVKFRYQGGRFVKVKK